LLLKELRVNTSSSTKFQKRMVANGIMQGDGNNGMRSHYQVEAPPL
jgi:hypothetical protein